MRLQLLLLPSCQILPDLILDTPAAPSLLEKFTEQAISDGCLPQNYQPPASLTSNASASNGTAPPVENGNHAATA